MKYGDNLPVIAVGWTAVSDAYTPTSQGTSARRPSSVSKPRCAPLKKASMFRRLPDTIIASITHCYCGNELNFDETRRNGSCKKCGFTFSLASTGDLYGKHAPIFPTTVLDEWMENGPEVATNDLAQEVFDALDQQMKSRLHIMDAYKRYTRDEEGSAV